MKDHKKEIREIISGDGSIIDNLDQYVKNKTSKNDKRWWLTLSLFTIAWICFSYCNRTTRQDVLNAAKPIVDSLHKVMQHKLDSIAGANDFTFTINGRK